MKLLRALEKREFERVGGAETIKSDFRLIAASNQPLDEMMEKGLFRSDLFYRLNVFPIHIKPLKERRDDIPVLAIHFLDFYKKKYSKNIQGILQRDMERLSDYDWPGNVRELQHIIERAVILSDGKFLIIPNLKPVKKREKQYERFSTIGQMEKSHIITALEKCGWRVNGSGGAAQLLSLKPQTLYSKMRRLGIRKSDIILSINSSN